MYQKNKVTALNASLIPRRPLTAAYLLTGVYPARSGEPETIIVNKIDFFFS